MKADDAMMSNFDSKDKTSVTLKMLIDVGILSPGLELVCPVSDVQGRLNPDGTISIQIEGREKVFDYLSGAARYIAKLSINGWTYWSARIDGKTYLMDNFRELYLASQNKKIS